MLPKLTPRLKAVAGLVRLGVIVADIGTDHAYLPVYLVSKGLNPLAYACDVAEGPLLSAEQTVKRFNAFEKVKLIKADGLCGVDYADDVVIAGMGGELIAAILARCEFIINKAVSLVLQPMTAAPELRNYLCQAGFEIKKELVVREGEKLYVVISASYNGNKFIPDELFLQTGKLPQTGGEFEHEFIKRQADILIKMAEGLKKSSSRAGEAFNIEQLARDIYRLCQTIKSEQH
jgi:tRNA (adenine22-N1)-methyltransferase